MNEEANLDELFAQFKQLEQSSSTPVATFSKDKRMQHFFVKYGMYIIYFVFLFILILALKPTWLFVKDEETQKQRFLYKRFFLVLFLSYGVLVGGYLGFQYYARKSLS